MSTTQSQWLTIRQSAEELDIAEVTVRRMIARGDLKAYRFGRSRVIRIKRADLDRLARPVTTVAAFLGGGDAA